MIAESKNYPSATWNLMVILLMTTNTFCFGQSITIKEANRKLATIFSTTDSRAEILVMGVFHFNYPNLDGHKTPDSLRVDMLSEQRQQEIAEVISSLKKFKPTKIAVEVLPQRQGLYDSLFQKYKQDATK